MPAGVSSTGAWVGLFLDEVDENKENARNIASYSGPVPGI
jgi:hypothetical protein